MQAQIDPVTKKTVMPAPPEPSSTPSSSTVMGAATELFDTPAVYPGPAIPQVPAPAPASLPARPIRFSGLAARAASLPVKAATPTPSVSELRERLAREMAEKIAKAEAEEAAERRRLEELAVAARPRANQVQFHELLARLLGSDIDDPVLEVVFGDLNGVLLGVFGDEPVAMAEQESDATNVKTQTPTNNRTTARVAGRRVLPAKRPSQTRRYRVSEEVWASLPLRPEFDDANVNLRALSTHRYFAISMVRRRIPRLDRGVCKLCREAKAQLGNGDGDSRSFGPFDGCYWSKKEITQEEEKDGFEAEWNACCANCRWMGRQCEL
ncbi:hypothetical protein BJ508DRAFT_315962 [Ascobolus immersus RN42]|uniref:Uncharacterized protein n=1 Tax=Ascobolus immersus RN42 TaxID=1160509 RepID=A0A3N4H8G4_ASCIM|nr:hypothetical protein BJ508DRAFT_315962 [Ascobolus immersus RN42]